MEKLEISWDHENDNAVEIRNLKVEDVIVLVDALHTEAEVVEDIVALAQAKFDQHGDEPLFDEQMVSDALGISLLRVERLRALADNLEVGTSIAVQGKDLEEGTCTCANCEWKRMKNLSPNDFLDN